MLTILRWLWCLALWIGAFVAVTALLNWTLEWHRSLSEAAILSVIIFLVMVILNYCQHRGWIKGTYWNPATREHFDQRRQELAEGREKIVADTKARHGG